MFQFQNYPMKFLNRAGVVPSRVETILLAESKFTMRAMIALLVCTYLANFLYAGPASQPKRSPILILPKVNGIYSMTQRQAVSLPSTTGKSILTQRITDVFRVTIKYVNMPTKPSGKMVVGGTLAWVSRNIITTVDKQRAQPQVMRWNDEAHRSSFEEQLSVDGVVATVKFGGKNVKVHPLILRFLAAEVAVGYWDKSGEILSIPNPFGTKEKHIPNVQLKRMSKNLWETSTKHNNYHIKLELIGQTPLRSSVHSISAQERVRVGDAHVVNSIDIALREK